MKTSYPKLILQACLIAAGLNGAWAADTPAPDADAGNTKAVKFVGTFLDFAEYNPGSGVNPNSWGNTSQLQLGADFDMDNLTGWSGATVHLRESFFLLRHNAIFDPGATPPSSISGHFWAQDTGSTLGGAPFPNFIPNNYLSELTLEQKVSSKAKFEFGRMNPMTRFDAPTNCENILSCQNPINLYDNLTLPPAFGTWGALVHYELDQNSYVRVGIYEDSFSSNRTNGLNWSMKNRSGWFEIAEYGVRRDLAETAYPWTMTAGIWHDTSSFTDPASGATQKGSDGAYLRMQKRVWHSNRGQASAGPAQYVTAFATAGYSPSSAQSYRGYGEIGANYHGLFPTRPNDYYGLKLAYLRINDNQLTSEQQARIALGGADSRSSNNQYRLELNGHIQIKKGVFVEPALQYIRNPNVQFSDPSVASNVPKNGFNVGLVLFVDLPALF